MSYLLYYRSNREAENAAKWFKGRDMHGDITHDIIDLNVDSLSQGQIAEIKQATNCTACLNEAELPE